MATAEDLEFAKRKWEASFQKWIGNGGIKEGDANYDPKFPEPEAHPEGGHLWNTDREQFIANA